MIIHYKRSLLWILWVYGLKMKKKKQTNNYYFLQIYPMKLILILYFTHKIETL